MDILDSDGNDACNFEAVVNKNVEDFVYLKADLINPKYVSLLRRYLIMNEFVDGRNNFNSGYKRPFIMRKLTTRLEIIDDDSSTGMVP